MVFFFIPLLICGFSFYYIIEKDPVFRARVLAIIYGLPQIGRLLEKLFTVKAEIEKQKKFNEIFSSVKDINKTSNETNKLVSEYLKTHDEKFIELLLVDVKKKIRGDIDNFRYVDALNSITTTLTLLRENELVPVLQNELDSFRGEIALKQGDYGTAKDIRDALRTSMYINESIVEFLCYYDALIDSEATFSEQVIEFKALGLSAEKINLKLGKYYYYQHNFQKTLELLCKDDDPSQLKYVYSKNKEAAYYAGLAQFDSKRYADAVSLLEFSIGHQIFEIKDYYLIKAKVYFLIDKKYSIFLLTEPERKELGELLSQLDSDLVAQYFRPMPLSFSEEYWILKLQIALYLDSSVAIEEYSRVPTEIKHNASFNELYGNLMMQLGKYEIATHFFSELYSSNKAHRLLLKLLTGLLSQKKYQEIIDIYGQLCADSFDDGLCSIIIEAFSHLNTIDNTIVFSNRLLETVDSPIHSLAYLGNLCVQGGQSQQASKYYDSMLAKMTNGDPATCKIIVKSIHTYADRRISLQCLEPYILTDKDIQKMYVFEAFKSGDEPYINKASSIIESNLATNPDDLEWLRNKAHYEICADKLNSAEGTLERIYQKDQSEDIVYNLSRLKLQLKKYENLHVLAGILIKSDNPHFIMQGAYCYHALDDHLKAEQFSQLAMAHLGNLFDEVLYAQYVQINFFSDTNKDIKVELDEVNTDCVINLINNSSDLWIGITSGQDILIKKNGNTFVDTLFYNCKDSVALKLNGAKKNEIVTYDDEQYSIKEIWLIKTKIIRHCLAAYDRYGGNKLFKKIEISPDHLQDPMLQLVCEMEAQEKELFSHYNFINSVGVPLYALSASRNKTLFDTIAYIWAKQNQAYYSGEINHCDITKRKIVLSPTSICVLHLLNVLDVLCIKHREYFIITKSCLTYFASIIEKVQNEEKNVEMMLGVKNGTLFTESLTAEMKNERLKFFRNLYITISAIQTEDIIIEAKELDDMADVINIISIAEYDGIKLSEQTKALYLVDDLLVSKLIKSNNTKIEAITSISLIIQLIQEDLIYLDLLLKLSSVGYIECYDYQSLIKIYTAVYSKSKILGSGSNFDILIKVIKNSLAFPADYTKKIPIIMFLQYIYEHYFNEQAFYVIEETLKYLFLLAGIQKISLEYLMFNIVNICKDKPDVMKYFRNIYASVIEKKII